MSGGKEYEHLSKAMLLCRQGQLQTAKRVSPAQDKEKCVYVNRRMKWDYDCVVNILQCGKPKTPLLDMNSASFHTHLTSQNTAWHVWSFWCWQFLQSLSSHHEDVLTRSMRSIRRYKCGWTPVHLPCNAELCC